MSWQKRFFVILARCPYPLLRLLGACLAQLLWWCARSRRSIALRNLELCFPDWSETQRKHCARQHFSAYVMSALDRSWLWFGKEQLIAQRVHRKGFELLPSDGQYILLCPHFIGLDVAWTSASMQRQMASIYQPAKNPAMESLMRDGRGRFNAPLGIGKHEGVRKLVRFVRSGAPLFYLPDMDFGEKNSVFAPFFGVPAATLTSLSWFAREFHLPVYPVLSRWDASTGHYHVEVLPAWDSTFPTGDEFADASYMNQQIEQWVLTNPTQYLWVHKRFKTRPPGHQSLY